MLLDNEIKCKKGFLDIGCGDGQLTSLIHEKLEIKTVGIDFSELHLKRAKNNFEEIEFIEHDIKRPIPLEDEKFDLIISHGVIQYFSYKEFGILQKEMFRLLADGGTCIHFDICDKSKFF